MRNHEGKSEMFFLGVVFFKSTGYFLLAVCLKGERQKTGQDVNFMQCREIR